MGRGRFGLLLLPYLVISMAKTINKSFSRKAGSKPDQFIGSKTGVKGKAIPAKNHLPEYHRKEAHMSNRYLSKLAEEEKQGGGSLGAVITGAAAGAGGLKAKQMYDAKKAAKAAQPKPAPRVVNAPALPAPKVVGSTSKVVGPSKVAKPGTLEKIKGVAKKILRKGK